MSQYRKTGLLVFCIGFGFLFLAFPERVVQGFHSGTQLCVGTVLPALFPFFVLCNLLVDFSWNGFLVGLLAKLWRTKKAVALSILLSWVGGYAVAASLAGQLYRDKKISPRDAALLMMLGCCSSPGFVISCVGGLLLGNLQLGLLLYSVQLVANLLSCAICMPFVAAPAGLECGNVPRPDDGGNLSRAIGAAVDSSLQVCGCVIFFRVVGAVSLPLLPRWPLAAPLVSGLLEISAGCADFAAEGGAVGLYGCCFCLSVLGLSVWAQLSLLLQGAVPLRVLAFNRVLHLILFMLLIRLLAPLLPGTAMVYSTLAQRVVMMQRLPSDAVVVVFFFLCAALYKVRQNFYNG